MPVKSKPVLQTCQFLLRQLSFKQYTIPNCKLTLKFCNSGMNVRWLVIFRIDHDSHAVHNGYCRHCVHKSSNARCGSSRPSLIRTRNVTASLPSTMRWS